MPASSPLRRSRPTAAQLTKFYFAFHQDSRIEQDDQFVLEKWIDESWGEEEKRSDKDAGPEPCRPIIGMSKLVADGTF